MTTLKQINDFFESQPIALVGVSRNPKKFGYAAYKTLKDKGMNIIPVNPNTDEIMGEKVYRNISLLPPDVGGVIIMTKKEKTASAVKDAMEKGIKHIWIQQMADTKEVLDELRDTDINYITGQCILMHYKPHSIHRFHASIMKFFGRFPK